MEYEITIKGRPPGLLQHNGAAGLDTRSATGQEIAAITKKKGANRTEADDDRLRELECQRGLWLDGDGAPTIPAAAVRSVIETGARKRKQGPQVREGLIVTQIVSFDYDREALGTTMEELGRKAQLTVGVVVGRARVLRTRPLFPEWSLTCRVEVDIELVDETQLADWLDVGGRRIGLGDWRPEKSGNYGRFLTEAITPIVV